LFHFSLFPLYYSIPLFVLLLLFHFSLFPLYY
jgi:hypothetical protein